MICILVTFIFSHPSLDHPFVKEIHSSNEMWLMTEQKNIVENSFWLVLEHKALRAVLAPTLVGGVCPYSTESFSFGV